MYAELFTVTAVPINELNAVEEPRGFVSTDVSSTSCCRVSIRYRYEAADGPTHNSENGNAPSLEKAQNILPVLSCDPTTHGPSAMKIRNVRAKAPPALLVAWRKSSANGSWVLELDRAVQSCTENIKSDRYRERIYQAGDETYDLVLPTSSIDPGSKDEFAGLMFRRACSDCDHYGEIADLQVEQREAIEAGY
ncbi:hypothetical protein KC358_g34 [Hortaea werneckii]|nr:hypothetical protein KC358_g34 [Hortaea werneckii]